MNLSAVDVNLLIVLDALIETTSVTRAGVRVGLSQPATSHALGRLRELFNDELLVRHGRSMVLTPRAEELGLAVRKWRALTEEVLSPSGAFVPSQARGTLTLAVA
ncbi:MAG: DNA-binding transcriptional LysR family regulator, partial [Bradymonadia bacterium]